ncbi:MAG: universal stress protein [Burkholderiales bacterium]|nr:universal stress protein [Burkholderiales bacterium]
MAGQLSPTGRFERIMLATDGSEYCGGAERVAFSMAEKFRGALQLASVVITNPAAESVAPERIQAAETETRALLDRLHADAAKRALAAETVFRRGPDPEVEIVAAAEELGADVIVMGRRGKRGLMKRMIGDATTKVVGAAKCSVLVVPEGADMWRRRILLATDGSRFSDAAAVAAARIAEICRLPVTVISTVRESFTEERAAQAEEAASRVHDHLAGTGLEVDKVVLRGDPDRLIPETAAAREADLIVMGTHGRTGWERVMVGSVTESVIGASPCPVLAVKL